MLYIHKNNMSIKSFNPLQLLLTKLEVKYKETRIRLMLVSLPTLMLYIHKNNMSINQRLFPTHNNKELQIKHIKNPKWSLKLYINTKALFKMLLMFNQANHTNKDQLFTKEFRK